ncbi:MAG: PspC domain-containing protein [Bacteroidetes bacterium]|nr:PspC domain-containing protein [Bacteroidota bacterium]
MNKTVTVNIGGMVFHIEEQAYDQLRKYLEAIRGYFTTSDGRDEIIQDIESRIAEMFSERIGTSRQVVTSADVEYMINTMGKPEQVAGADEEKEQAEHRTWNSTESRGYRKLYRDPDDKVIGGVCSGLSHYVGMDPIWLRLIFAGAFFIWGSGLLLYILLLIIIPKAKTTSEKLEMKGQAVNIDNIKRTIEEEVEDIKNRISGKPGARRGGRSAVANFFEAIGAIIVAAIKFFVGFIGVIMAIVLIAVLFALFMVLLGMTGVIGDASLPIFLTHSFLDTWQMNMMTLALALVVGIPALVLLYRIVRSIFKITSESKIFNYTCGVLWGLGIIIATFIGFQIAREFRVSDTNRVTIPIAQPTSDTIHLAMLNPYDDKDDVYYNGDWKIMSDGWSINSSEDTARIEEVELDVQRADGDKYELVRITTSRGPNRKEAELNARGVIYELQQMDNVLKFSRDYILPKDVHFRAQKIRLILKVPVGKSVFLGENTEDIIYDIKNTTNTWDNDMVGHTWTMTNRGLECANCNFETNSSKSNDDEVKVRVNGEDVNIKVNSDTINWDNKDVKIKIDGEGIIIDAKDKK